MVGSGPIARAFNQLRAYLMANRPAEAPGTLFTRTPHGTMRSATKPQPVAQSVKSSSPQRFLVKSDQPDYYECVFWDGSTEGAAVNVAKDPTLRRSLSSERIDGVSVSYSYTGLVRTASATGKTSQSEVVIPVVHTNSDGDGYSEIWADKPAGGTGVVDSGDNPVEWMDTNRAARAWCQKPG